MLLRLILLLAACAASSKQASFAQTPGYYQTPAISDDTLVFASEGDLWRAPVAGGAAIRLTTHPEIESSPVLSPDGKWIAFNAAYDGPAEIYLIPAAGGPPVRLTHEGGDVAVRGWLDNDRILYRTSNIPGTIPRLLRTIHRQSSRTEDIPLADADQAAILSDGQTLVFTRFGLSMFDDNAVQYRGGRMTQLWRYTLGSDTEAVRLAADFGAPMLSPMAWNGRIFFISDKSGSDNIWSIREDGTGPVQHTGSSSWQMRTPYLHNGKIAYQSGADIYLHDIASGTTGRLALSLTSDSDFTRERWLGSPLAFLEDVRFAPSGEAVTVTARGRLVTAFPGLRRRVEYVLPEASRARSGAMSADGKSVFAIVDSDSFGEIWQFPADGRGEGKPVTSGTEAYIWRLFPAPMGKSLLYTTKRGQLFEMDTETGQKVRIDDTSSSADDAFRDFTWSADGRYLAYTSLDARDIAQVILFDTRLRTRTVLTTGKYESLSPAFSADGAWLYFLSNRNFDASPGSPWGDRNMGPGFSARAKLYALQLDASAPFPFEVPDELAGEKAAPAPPVAAPAAGRRGSGPAQDKPDGLQVPPPAKVDLAGVQSRLWEVPARPGDYLRIAANGTHIFLQESSRGDDLPSLRRLKITSEKPAVEDFAGKVAAFSLSVDGSKLFVQVGEKAQASLLVLSPGEKFPDDPSASMIRLADWRPAIDPREEWRQMALDAWRLHRDFAYDSQLRSVDWDRIRDHFVPLAARVGYRAELNDLLGQMSAELGILHSQIRPGELPRDLEGGEPGFLGAVFEASPTGLKVSSILLGETDRPETLGPLHKPGVDVRNGDVITAINGSPVRTPEDLSAALTMQAGQQVRLDFLRDKSVLSEIVVPASRGAQRQLLYTDWLMRQRTAVAKASAGRIGYLHLRAMGPSDIASFARDFYEHYDKQGLVIDVRGNRGGNIDSWIIGTLLRKAWAFWPGPGGQSSNTNMQHTFRGHLAVLINEGTYSDGETFAAGIRALDLAPLIGTRTAGAGIWLSDRNPLSDGGQARVAEFPQHGLDGRWMIEGRGVSPDIEVENLPRATHLGEDAQLARALSYLERKITEDPLRPLVAGPLPPLGEPGRDMD